MRKQNLFISSFKEAVLFFCMLCLILITVFLFIMQIVCPQYSNDYTASLIDKVDRLESIEEPKIVLIGNSNLAFGMDSQQLEKAFDMPVVNMGLHGGFGNAFHEEMAKINLGKGDIIIIAHTSYGNEGENNPVLKWITLENHWNLYKLIDKESILPLIKAYPSYVKKAITLWRNESGNQVPGNAYSRKAFNEYGDISLKRGNEFTFHQGDIVLPQVGDGTVKRLNKLNQYIVNKGATMLIAGFPIPDGEYTPDRIEYIQFQNVLKEKIAAPVISDLTNYMLPYEYFYDGATHLNTEGVKIRTKQLIKDLQQWKQDNKERTNKQP